MGIIGLIVAFIIIGIIILIHEFGHYIMGKLSNCSVSRFSIGWGPKIFSFKKKETNYQISWLPFIGGYVRMPGIEGESAELTDEEAKDINKYNLRTFEDLRTWQKFLVFLGGVGLQIILCIVILTFVVNLLGKPHSQVLIGSVKEDSPAQQAGLKKEDIILKADNERIQSVTHFISIISDKAKKPVALTVKRNDNVTELKVIPEYYDEYNRALIGVQPLQQTEYKKENMKWHDYVFGGVKLTWRLTVMLFIFLGKLITGQFSLKFLTGPVGMIAITSKVAQTGILNLVLLFVSININLAVLNSLPFPALDGGHALMLSIEKIFRIKIKPKVKEIITLAGFTFLIILMIYVTFNDVVGLMGINKRTESNQQTQVENNEDK